MEGDFLLTGDPGIGKTALIRRLAQHYRERGHDVVLLDAESFGRRVNDKLARPLETVLRAWEGEEPGHVLIDALDGDRGEMVAWMADTVERIRGTRWRTVASARLFDITNNQRWRKAFKGKPAASEPGYRRAELDGVRHSLATGFNAGELALAGTEVAGLGRVLTGADTELLERYWGLRAVDEDQMARSRFLRELCRSMLDGHRLQVSQEELAPEHDKAVRELVANGVLRQIRPRYTYAMPSLAFAHHIFFDYAVSQLIFVGGGRSQGSLQETVRGTGRSRSGNRDVVCTP